MNTITTAARKTARRVLVLVAGAVAALGLTIGTAAPSQAAAPLWSGLISANTYYGFVGGNAFIPYYGQTTLSFSLAVRDNRNDRLCSVAHARGVYQNGAVTGWTKVGTSCDLYNNTLGGASFTAPSGYYFNNAQVRVCQSDRYGNVIGSCTNPISPYTWQLRY